VKSKNNSEILDVSSPGRVVEGDSAKLIWQLPPESVDLSVWSPPYHVGKQYEADLSFDDWVRLLGDVIRGHSHALKPGGFCAINIADILCFPDEEMPRIQAETINERRLAVSKEDVLRAAAELGTNDRRKIGAHLGVSEQTVDRRLKGNNIRGGKYQTQTRVKTVAGLIEQLGLNAGLFIYDRRVWVKDPAWANSRWHTSSLRAIDEFEYIFVLWKPGITTVNRKRLEPEEWRDWGSRGVWTFPSVRSNDNHEAKFPLELPRRVIKLLSDEGDLVLDPFSGSGTSLVAAIELDRIALGFELSPKYARLSERNLSAAIIDREARLPL
jgi:site-specific DNA-methyltransferase (adenine-specific)